MKEGSRSVEHRNYRERGKSTEDNFSWLENSWKKIDTQQIYVTYSMQKSCSSCDERKREEMVDPGGSGSRACSLKCFLFSSTLQLTRSCLITDTASSGLHSRRKRETITMPGSYVFQLYLRRYVREGTTWRKFVEEIRGGKTKRKHGTFEINKILESRWRNETKLSNDTLIL